MKTSILTISILLCAIFFHNNVTASHTTGTTMRYDYVGPGIKAGTYKYRITVYTVRDCKGIAYNQSCLLGGSYLWAKCVNSGTFIDSIPLTWKPYIPQVGDRPNSRGAKDVSNVCSKKKSSCELNSRVGPGGYEVFLMEAEVSLPACNAWEITYRSCECCAPSSGNFNGGAYNVAQTQINTSGVAQSGGMRTSSGPFLTTDEHMVYYVAIGQKAVIDLGGADPEGDSLKYQFVCPRKANSGAGRPVIVNSTPRNSATCSTPIPGIKLDQYTGIAEFTMVTTGVFTFAYLVDEYDPCSGAFLGQTYKDVYVVSHTTTNKVPTIKGGFFQTQGKPIPSKNGYYEVCEGEELSWTDTILDVNLTNKISVRTNVKDVFPGIKIVDIPTGKQNEVIRSYTWKAKSTGKPFIRYNVGVTDDHCDHPGKAAKAYLISVLPAGYTGESQTICLGDSVHFDLSSGDTILWKSISGSPLISGVNWFPDTTSGGIIGQHPIFIPQVNTTLEVTKKAIRNSCGKVIQSCSVTDTIEITVADSFSLAYTADMKVCHSRSGSLEVTPQNPKLSYSYQWKKDPYLVSDSTKNTQFQGLKEERTFYTTVLASSGCKRSAMITVDVSDPFPLNPSVLVRDSILCLEDTIVLGTDFSNSSLNKCGTNPYKMVYTPKTIVNGSVVSQVTNATRPVVYQGEVGSEKLQFLYTAALLNQKGVKRGFLNSIAFEVLSIDTTVKYRFKNFSIQLACVGTSQMTSTFITSDLTEVFYADSVLPVKGWNVHPFGENYEWDGKSNILVTVCWDNQDSIYPKSPVMQFDLTSYAASVHYGSPVKGLSACTILNANQTPQSLLPNTRFGYADQIDRSQFVYQWSTIPGAAVGGFVGATNQPDVTIAATLNTAGKYQLVISDSAGICNDTLQQNIHVVSKYDSKPDSMLNVICMNDGLVRLKVPTPGGKWSGKGIVNDSLGIWDPMKSGTGLHWVQYEITGDTCASKDSTRIGVSTEPRMDIHIIREICGSYGNRSEHELKGKFTTGYFSGFGVDSSTTLAGTKYWINGKVFNLKDTIADTAVVFFRTEKWCANDTVIRIPVIAPWDSTYLGVNYSGVNYLTTTFCASDSVEQLSVKGTGGAWDIINYPQAINHSSGLLNVTRLPEGRHTVVVEKTGFCGSKNSFGIEVINAPEIEIIENTYCRDWCVKNPGHSNRRDTLRLRMPKGPALGGTKKSLDPNGFDPTTERIDHHFDGGSSGWNANSALNIWSGPNSFFLNSRVGWFKPCTKAFGVYQLAYEYGLVYRTQIPDSICYRKAMGEVEVTDTVAITLDSVYYLCNQPALTLKQSKRKGLSYLWGTNGKSNEVVINAPGNYMLTVFNEYCHTTSKFRVDQNCLSIVEEKGELDVNVYPNPTDGLLRVNAWRLSEQVRLSVTDVTGAVVYDVQLEPFAGSIRASIDLTDLSVGIYYLTINTKEKLSTFRVVKE